MDLNISFFSPYLPDINILLSVHVALLATHYWLSVDRKNDLRTKAHIMQF